jgi:hypothetical protein
MSPFVGCMAAAFPKPLSEACSLPAMLLAAFTFRGDIVIVRRKDRSAKSRAPEADKRNFLGPKCRAKSI